MLRTESNLLPLAMAIALLGCGADDTIAPADKLDGGQNPDGSTTDGSTTDGSTTDGSTTDGSTATTTDILFATEMGGGDMGLGAFRALSQDGSSDLGTVHAVEGQEWLRGGDAEDYGFTYSPADDAFYGIISGGGAGGHGALMKLDANTKTLSVLLDLPELKVDDNYPLGAYLQRPVISEDGKSLLVVASRGGTGEICQQCGTHGDGSPIRVPSSGGLVHVNMDATSADYLKPSVIFSFSGEGTTTETRIYNVIPDVVLGRDAGNTKDVLFVVSEGVTFGLEDGPKTSVAGRAFFLTPSDPTDWSKPWTRTGHSEGVGGGDGRITRQPGYNPMTRTFAYAFQATDVSEVYAHTMDTNGASLPVILAIANHSCYAPRVSFFAQNNPQLICAGLSGPPDMYPDGSAKLFDVEQQGNPILKRNFSNWYVEDAPSKSLRQPAAVRQDSASSMFVNVSTHWLSVNQDLGFQPSHIDEYNVGDTSVRTRVEGSATNGWAFIGAPAVGSKPTEPIADRYVVQFARGGGDRGFGTVLTYDRLDDVATPVALGPATVAYPQGRPHALRDGKVLGTARYVNPNAPTDKRERFIELGLYRLDANAGGGAPEIIQLPPFSSNAYPGKMEHASPNVQFKEVGDTLWAVTFGYFFKTIGNTTDADAVLLYALDPTTGEPTGETHGFGTLMERTFAPSRWISSLSARGNTLFFLGPQQDTDVTGAGQEGHRAWCVDLAQRDGNTPKSGFALVNQLANGPTSGLWSPTGGATLSAKDGELYILTTKSESSAHGALLQVKVSDCVNTGPAFTTKIADLGVIPSTELFDGSDGFMYFGTTEGKLMQFDTEAGTVKEAADFKAATGSSHVIGYFSEDAGGTLFGVVADENASGAPVARRLFSYRLADGNTSARDASDIFHVDDATPGVVPMTVNR